MTKREIIDDVILQLTAFKPSDDLEIPDTLVGFWIDTIRAALLEQKINQDFLLNHLILEAC